MCLYKNFYTQNAPITYYFPTPFLLEPIRKKEWPLKKLSVNKCFRKCLASDMTNYNNRTEAVLSKSK